MEIGGIKVGVSIIGLVVVIGVVIAVVVGIVLVVVSSGGSDRDKE